MYKIIIFITESNYQYPSMLSIKKSKKGMPDLTEFTDENGNQWIQTSVDDLLSSNELNDILNKIEKDKVKDEIVLAKFNFQKVNKEYYETILDLEERLQKQNSILKKLLIEARNTIDKKNTKLNELIQYIRKLHTLLAYYKTKPEDLEKMLPSPDKFFYEPAAIKKDTEIIQEIVEEPEKIIIEYTNVQEIMLDENGREITK